MLGTSQQSAESWSQNLGILIPESELFQNFTLGTFFLGL